ncbi:MAG: hypothetical protein V4687_04415 [Bacteroidota bacterium]
MDNIQAWQLAQKDILEKKSIKLTDGVKKSNGYDFILSAIEKIPLRPQTDNQLQNFRTQTETLIAAFPTNPETFKSEQAFYKKAFSTYKNYILKEYKLVMKGFYIAIWLSLGISIGVAFGVSMGNIALGIPIGIGIGMAIGAGLDAKAQKEGRTI